MKKTKVMILTCSLKVGGAERQMYNLISNMDKRKFNFVIACLYDLGAIGESLVNMQENISVYHNIMKNKFDFLGVIKLIRTMRNEKVDILFIVHTPLTLFWGILCAKFASIGASATRFTSTNPTRHVKRRKLVNFLTLSFVDRVIAQASSHGYYLVEHEGVDRKKLVVINNSVDIERFNITIDESSLRKELGIPLKVPIVGIVANFRPEKGHKFILRAAKDVIDIFPDTNFLLVGDGEERNMLEKMSEDLKIRSNIHFLGSRKDIPQIITLLDVAVMASSPSVETFSNSVFEYMAVSKPVVATNVGSVAEQVVDGETGFLIPSEDCTAMSEAVLKLLGNRDSAKVMGTAGRERVRANFNIEIMISKYESLFSDLLKQNN